jgi:hypothetical protein
MGLKGKLDKLQKAMRGKLDSFELVDGRRHYFDRQEVYGQAFLFFSNSLRSDHSGEARPDPPPILQAISNARDRGDALERALGAFSHILPIDRGALLSRGALVPRSLVQGVELEDLGELEDLSE